MAHQAFVEWKAAHDAYIAAERRLADAETVYACMQAPEPTLLRAEVARQRDEADRLLARAMEALRAGAEAPPETAADQG